MFSILSTAVSRAAMCALFGLLILPWAATADAQSALAGCITIRNETFDSQGSPMTPVAQFTYRLDGTHTTVNNAAGVAQFNNVSVGNHTVAEVIPANWTLLSVTPANGNITVTPGSVCTTVTFRNKQVILQNPTFAIVKTDGRSTVQQNEVVTYTITVSNTSTVHAQNVQVTDTLPNGVSFLSASDGGIGVGNIVSWTIPSIAANSSRTITVQARVNSTVAGGAVLRNVAQVIGGPFAEDTTTVQGVTGCPIDVTLESDEDEPATGDELTYEVTVTNITNTAQNNVEVTLALPDEVEFVDATEDGEEDNGEVVWEVDLGSFDEETFEVTVEVDGDVDEGDELDAVVFADCTSDSLTLEVEEGDDDDEDEDEDEGKISIRKEASPPEVFPGGVVEYILTVENNDDAEITDIFVVDRFNPTLLTVTDDGGAEEEGNGELIWEIDSLDEDETEVIRYRAIVDSAALPGQVIRNDVVVESEDDEEDRASATVIVLGTLPQTGVRMGGDGGSRFVQPWTGSEGGNAAEALLTIGMGLLTGAAGMAGKKFFLS